MSGDRMTGVVRYQRDTPAGYRRYTLRVNTVLGLRPMPRVPRRGDRPRKRPRG